MGDYWLRRMGDPTTGQAGLEGLGQVRDALTARLLRRDGVTASTSRVYATLVEAETLVFFRRIRRQCWALRGGP